MPNDSVRSEWDKKKMHESQRLWLANVVSQAQTTKFYGRVTLVFEDGTLKRVIKEESLKPPVPV